MLALLDGREESIQVNQARPPTCIRATTLLLKSLSFKGVLSTVA